MKSKSLVVISVLGLLAGIESAKAQAVLSGAGGIDLKGGSSFSPASQSGGASRFLWLPDKAALVAGYFSSTPNTGDIGDYSIALGGSVSAPGSASVALGNNSLASGNYAFAGAEGYALGDRSVAFTGGEAWGANSVAMGFGIAYGDHSVALGWSVTSTWSGTALGNFNLNVKKDGISTPDPVTPTLDDPIFEIGNGDWSGDEESLLPPLSNALTVFRDGTIRIGKASGGISMGQFH